MNQKNQFIGVLWEDLTTIDDKIAFLEAGRGAQTGILSPRIQDEVVEAFKAQRREMKEYSTAMSILESWYQNNVRYQAVRTMRDDVLHAIIKKAFSDSDEIEYKQHFDKLVDQHLDYNGKGES